MTFENRSNERNEEKRLRRTRDFPDLDGDGVLVCLRRLEREHWEASCHPRWFYSRNNRCPCWNRQSHRFWLSIRCRLVVLPTLSRNKEQLPLEPSEPRPCSRRLEQLQSGVSVACKKGTVFVGQCVFLNGPINMHNLLYLLLF